MGIDIGNILRVPFPIYHHSQVTGYPVDVNCITIVDREAHSTIRTIKEAMFIHVNGLSLNRNPGKYQLPYIWDELLRTSNHSTSGDLEPQLLLNGPAHLFSKSHKGGHAHFHEISKYGPSIFPGSANSTPFPPQHQFTSYTTGAICGK